MNETDDVVYAQPTTEDARTLVASACLLDLQLEMPRADDESVVELLREAALAAMDALERRREERS